MISSFIFTGDFEDPHDEFFVKKVYRRNAATQEFIFMLSSDPQRDIPAFLLEIAPTIFKAGCTLHLLTKRELLPLDAKSLGTYYAICSHQPDRQTCRTIFSSKTSSQIKLDFEISRLKELLEARKSYYLG